MTKVYLFDWGDTLMVDFPGVPGKMCDWKKVQAVDGAREALEFLARRARIHVASGAVDSTERDIAAALRRVGLHRYVTGYYCKANVGVPKGDPAFLPRILAELDLAPERVAMVGDSLPRDVEPALAVGMPAIWLNGNGSPAPASGVRVIASLRELVG